MTAKTQRTLQVPGQAPNAADPAVTASLDAAPPADETLEEKVARLESENAGLRDVVADRDAAIDAADKATLAEPLNRDPSKLRASDVDPYKIRRSVLTVDGWVCPAVSPAPPTRQ